MVRLVWISTRPHLRFLAYVRPGLMVLCLLALLPVAWPAQEVAAQLRREREASALSGEGFRHLLAGRWSEAARAFRRVTILAPYEPEAYGSLAEAEYHLGNVDAAVGAYRRLLAIYPYTYVGAVHRDLGFLELRARRYADAQVDLTEAVTLDPADWHAYFLLGHAHRRAGDTDGARAAWQRVVELRPDYQPARDQLRSLGE